MNQATLAIAPETLQSCLDYKDFKDKLIQENKGIEWRLGKISELPKYDAEIKQEKAYLEERLKSNRFKLMQLEVMDLLSVGDWVQNGSPKPGKITELRVINRIPEVLVLWDGNTAPIPEAPQLL